MFLASKTGHIFLILAILHENLEKFMQIRNIMLILPNPHKWHLEAI